MKRSIVLVLCMALTEAVSAAVLRPADFTRQAPLTLDGSGPFYQLALPLPVYQGVTRADLGDLRVFNGKGEVVPHALQRMHAGAVSENVKEYSAPLFPILATDDTKAGIEVDVRRTGDDTLVAVRQQPRGQPNASVRGVVIDLSRAPKGEIRSLRLKLGAAKTPFVAFRLESSDDLQHWRTLRDDGQVVAMEHQGQRIENSSISWASDAGKYLRLVWDDPALAPSVDEAVISSVVTALQAAPLLWTEALAPQAGAGPDFEYLIAGQIPVQQLRVDLHERNSLVSVKVQHAEVDRNRPGARERWSDLAQSIVYRLDSKHGEIVSPVIDLGRGPMKRLRLSLDTRAGGVGSQPPMLRIRFTPDVLVFLARGEGPFSVAWGADAVPDVAMSVASLVPGYRAGQALTASPAALGNLIAGATAPQQVQAGNEAPATASKYVLWAVLIVGVLLLGGMASMLMKQMKTPDKPPT